MGTRSPLETRVVWAFWVAAGLIAVGGVVPILLAGPSGRISLVIIPFWIAAIAFGACALLHHRGRAVPTVLYSLGGLLVVYGILAVLAVPLRLAVIGTCPPEPAQCPAGFLRPLTDGESTGLGFAIGMGIVAVLVGFFGLVIVFRRMNTGAGRAAVAALTPPVRRIPPVNAGQATPATPPAEAAPTSSAPVAAGSATSAPAAEEAAPVEPEPLAELPAPVEELELPAHVTDDPAETGDAAPSPSAN